MTKPESRHRSAAHAVIEKLNEKPHVRLEQFDGKDIIAQALADMEAKFWGYLRELARQVQRTVKRNDEDPAQEENTLLAMADDVLSERLLRATVDELIANSSLGTPEAVAMRKQTDPKDVDRVIQRAAVSDKKPGADFGDTVILVFQMTDKGVHARVEGRGDDYYLFEPTTRWKALERLGDLMGWRSRSSTMSGDASAPSAAPAEARTWEPTPDADVRIVGSPYPQLNGRTGKVKGRHLMHPNPNLWEIDMGSAMSGVWNIDSANLVPAGPPLHAETKPEVILQAVRNAVVDHIRDGEVGHLRDAVSGLATIIEQLIQTKG